MTADGCRLLLGWLPGVVDRLGALGAFGRMTDSGSNR